MDYRSGGNPLISDPSSNPNWMLDHHIKLMAQAEAEREWWKFWTYFKFVIKRILPFMEVDARRALEEDWQELERLTREIELSKDAEQTKNGKIEKLRLAFIKAHESYVAMNLPRTGIITVSEDSELDFGKMDFEVMKRAVRASSHDVAKVYGEARQKAEEKQEAKNAASV